MCSHTCIYTYTLFAKLACGYLAFKTTVDYGEHVPKHAFTNQMWFDCVEMFVQGILCQTEERRSIQGAIKAAYQHTILPCEANCVVQRLHT